MTHRLCYVVISADVEDTAIESEVASVLETYDCNREVDEYTEDCGDCTEDDRSSCDNCHGTGKYKTTHNQDGLFDWYEIGGRWADLVGGTHAFSSTWALFAGIRAPAYLIDGGLDEFDFTKESNIRMKAWFRDNPDARLVIVDIHI